MKSVWRKEKPLRRFHPSNLFFLPADYVFFKICERSSFTALDLFPVIL